MRRIVFLFTFFMIGISISVFAQESIKTDDQALINIKNDLEKILNENIIPFWYPEVIDEKNGGYRLNHDINGKWLGDSDKYLVTQARTIWFFSKLARSKYGKEEYLKCAKHGYEFLISKMWDRDYGGFYWAVNSKGDEATITYKHLYGQSFALYALSEYAMASGDRDAKALAKRIFNIIDFLAHDSNYSGYKESFKRNWTLPDENELSLMGTTRNIKLMNTHLHLMEAITAYYEATKDPVARERLIELVMIQSNSVVRKNIGACSDKYEMDWTPIDKPEYNRVSYGHDIENVWLLIEACNSLGMNNQVLVDLYRTLFDYSLKYGYDQENGGFYDSGAFNANADNRSKVWWVQAECMLSALYMYNLTSDVRYLYCFKKTLDWIMKHQVDWENGDWFSSISESGEPSGEKSGAWKSPYHNGRAVIESLELIKALIGSQPDQIFMEH
jgi:mannobiose 2-epimerase